MARRAFIILPDCLCEESLTGKQMFWGLFRLVEEKILLSTNKSNAAAPHTQICSDLRYIPLLILCSPQEFEE